jgi:hypothetical protein
MPFDIFWAGQFDRRRCCAERGDGPAVFVNLEGEVVDVGL